jgi:hypothetical protein
VVQSVQVPANVQIELPEHLQVAGHYEEGMPKPWEEPGAVRRDVESHRAPALLLLAGFSIVFGLFGYGPLVAWKLDLGAPVYGTALFSIVAFPLGLAVKYLARRDLAKMRAGNIDPGGQTQTRTALFLGELGAALSILPLILITIAFVIALSNLLRLAGI